jgi:hypothetical protein
MNKLDSNIAAILAAYDADHHISRHMLYTFADCTDRAARASIHRLRNAGNHIISDPSQPGYWMGTDDEWNDFCDRERRAALNRLHRKTWENGRQLKIEVER